MATLPSCGRDNDSSRASRATNRHRPPQVGGLVAVGQGILLGSDFTPRAMNPLQWSRFKSGFNPSCNTSVASTPVASTPVGGLWAFVVLPNLSQLHVCWFTHAKMVGSHCQRATAPENVIWPAAIASAEPVCSGSATQVIDMPTIVNPNIQGPFDVGGGTFQFTVTYTALFQGGEVGQEWEDATRLWEDDSGGLVSRRSTRSTGRNRSTPRRRGLASWK
jgi:hypothetical protein